MSRLRPVISVIVLVAVGVGTGVLWRKLERAPAEAAAGANAEPAEPAERAATMSVKTVRGPGDAARNVLANVSRQLAGPAELQQREELGGQIAGAHPDLATKLELTPEEAERFFELLAGQQMQIAELIAGRPGSIRNGVYSRDLQRDMHLLEAAGDHEQMGILLGKYPQWLEYQEEELQQNPIDQLQRMLVGQGANSGDVQIIGPLTEALVAEQKRLSQDLPDVLPAQGRYSREEELQRKEQLASSNRQLVEVASRYLRADQLAAFDQLLEQRLQGARRLLRAMERGGESGVN